MGSVKVLLNQKVEKLGDIGDIVNVRLGYARNYLLPNGLATLPSIGELKRIEKRRAILEKQYQEEKSKAEEIAKKITELGQVEIIAEAGEAGKLFGSITTKDIVETLKKEAGVEIPRKQILLRRSISEVGEYNIKIKLHTEVQPEIKLVVKPEENKDKKD